MRTYPFSCGIVVGVLPLFFFREKRKAAQKKKVMCLFFLLCHGAGRAAAYVFLTPFAGIDVPVFRTGAAGCFRSPLVSFCLLFFSRKKCGSSKRVKKRHNT